MGAVITFSYANWIAAFPQFSATVTESAATLTIIPIAQNICRIDGGSPVEDASVLTALFNMLVSHIAQLLYGSSTQALSPIVGRVSNATEGSVSVGTDYGVQPASAAWYNQTQYGATYWKMIQGYTLGFYAPRQVPIRRPWIYN